MNPSERTKEALLGKSIARSSLTTADSLPRCYAHSRMPSDGLPAKTEALCGSIIDTRKDDPWGGDGYLSTILRAVKMQDATDYSEDDTRTEFPPALDYATSAQRELLIREQSAALVSSHLHRQRRMCGYARPVRIRPAYTLDANKP